MATTEIKRIIEITTGRSNQTIRELKDTIAQGRAAMQDLDITSQEFAETSEQVTNAQTLLRNAVRGTTAAVEGSYDAYSAEISMLKKQRKALSESSDEYAQMTARIVELNAKLSAMDAEIGVYGRNVGNYSSAFSGLNMETQQLVRELPSLTMGFNQFVLGISNNLPMFADRFKQVKEETGSFMATLKAVGKSLMSWNVLLVAAVTILANWDKIRDWITNLREGREELDASARAAKRLREELEQGNAGFGESVIKVKMLSDAWRDLGDNMTAKEQFIRENASAFEELGVSVTTVNDAEKLLVDDTGKFIQAMQQRARVTATMNLATEAYEKMFLLRKKLQETPRRVEVPYTPTYGGMFGGGPISVGMRKVSNPEYDNVFNELEAAKEELIAFYKLLTDASGSYEDLMSNFGGSGGSDKMTFFPESIGDADVERIIAEMMDGRWRNLMPSQGITGGTASDADKVLKMELERNLAMLYANAEERIAIEEEYNERILELRLQALDDENARLEDQLTNLELSVAERAEIEDAITQNLIEQTELRLDAEERAAKKSEKIAKEEADTQMKIAKQKAKEQKAWLGATADILGAASDMAKEGTKRQKGLASAEALINTYAAANETLKAYAGVKIPGYAWAQVAATILMGLANVKAIWEVDETGQSSPDMSIANGVPPSVASNMPASYTRNLIGDSELTEMNKPIKAYVVESEATAQMELSKQKEQSASF
jgi:hypothetical protein